MVTLDERCRAVTYNTHAIHTVITQNLNQQAGEQLGGDYHLTGEVQSQISSQEQNHSTITLHVQGRGTYASQFSHVAFTHMRALLAGKGQAQAKEILLHIPGVRSASLNITGKETTTLPADRTAMRFLIIEPVVSARQASDE